MLDKLYYTIVSCLAITIIVVLTLLAGFIGSELRKSTMYKDYNNGICKDCGGKYEYAQALDYGEYLYICNQCNNAVELDKIYR